jgi:iron complex transport system substrate-binding protein
MTSKSISARLIVGVTALALAATALPLAGCQDRSAEKSSPIRNASSKYPVTVTDDAGRKVTVEGEPKRIVSLAPANTEILFALGLGDRVVGVTSYDDYPAQVSEIAKVGDFAGPNIEAVAAADPDLVLATTGVQADVIKQLEGLGAVVIAVDPQTLGALYDDIDEIATVTNRPSEGDKLVARMQDKVAEIRDAVSKEPTVSAFIEIGQNPLFTVGSGTLLGELLEAAGGSNVVSQVGYVPYSVEQLVKADPAFYLATKGTMSDPSALEKRAGYKGLTAVREGHVAILDDNLVTRPGPRVVDGLEQIARALHPDAFEEKAGK